MSEPSRGRGGGASPPHSTTRRGVAGSDPAGPTYAAPVDPSPFPRMTGTADVSARPARPGHAPGIAPGQVVTWRAAYPRALPREVLEDWDEAAATVSWHAAVTAPPTPGHGVLVALE